MSVLVGAPNYPPRPSQLSTLRLPLTYFFGGSLNPTNEERRGMNSRCVSMANRGQLFEGFEGVVDISSTLAEW